MPRARALTSRSAFSIAPMACWTTPPADVRRSACISATCASWARGSLPTRAGARRRISAVRPDPPNVSLYSLQPTRPSSVVTLTKSNARRPPSACSVSRLVIRIAPPRWGQDLASMQLAPRAGGCVRLYRSRGLTPILRSMETAAAASSTFRTMCPMNCHPTLCGMLVRVEDGRLLGVRGDPDNPDSRGFLCVRGQASREIVDNPKPAPPPARPRAPGRGRLAPGQLGRGARRGRRPDARGRPRGGRALVGARSLREQLRDAGRLPPPPALREPLGLPVVAPLDDLLGAGRLRPRADGRPRGEHEGGHGRPRAPRPALGREPRQPAEHRPAPGRRPPPRGPRRHDRRARDRGRGAVGRGDPDPARDRRRARPGDDVGHRRGRPPRRGVRGPPHRRLRRAGRARPRPRPRLGGAHHRGARRPHRCPRPPLRDDAARR